MRHRGKASNATTTTTTTTTTGEAFACFAYGSNGTEQLKTRCKNSNLVSHKAAIRDYKRFFTGNSKKWGGGGVASLAPHAGSLCKGSVVYLTESELDLLDRFEGIPEGSDPFVRDYEQNRYSRRWVEVEVWMSNDDGSPASQETVRAIAYVRNKTDWEGMPSRKYMDACYRNIVPFWPEVDRYGKLLVYSFDAGGGGAAEDQGAAPLELRGEYTGTTDNLPRGVVADKTFLGRMPRYDSSHVALSSTASPFVTAPDQNQHRPLYWCVKIISFFFLFFIIFIKKSMFSIRLRQCIRVSMYHCHDCSCHFCSICTHSAKNHMSCFRFFAAPSPCTGSTPSLWWMARVKFFTECTCGGRSKRRVWLRISIAHVSREDAQFSATARWRTSAKRP